MNISTHVLDASAGVPAAGMVVRLDGRDGGVWRTVATERTDQDGRITGFSPVADEARHYRLAFDTASYFMDRGLGFLYPEIVVTVAPAEPDRHLHVPLVLTPYGYTTYQGR